MPGRLLALFVVVGFTALVTGCGTGPTWKEKTYTRTAHREPLNEAREMLARFVVGDPVGDDDALLAPDIVIELRKVAPEKAELFEKGFERLRKSRGNTAAVAASLLKQL